MTSTTGPAPGWYHDATVPGALRWFDGAAWTEQLAPAPAAPGSGTGAAPVPPGWVDPRRLTHLVPSAATEGASPTDVMHWILPVGRSWQSIAAGYVGLIGLLVWPLAPVSVALGVWALSRGRDGGHGRGRAVFAIVAGVVGSLTGLAVLSGILV